MSEEQDFKSKRVQSYDAPNGRGTMILRPITRAEGHVMYRPRGGMVFVMSEKEWLKLPIATDKP